MISWFPCLVRRFRRVSWDKQPCLSWSAWDKQGCLSHDTRRNETRLLRRIRFLSRARVLVAEDAGDGALEDAHAAFLEPERDLLILDVHDGPVDAGVGQYAVVLLE